MVGVLGLAALPPLGAVNSWPPARAPCPHCLTASLRQVTAPEVGQGAVRQARLPSGFKKEGGECSPMLLPLCFGRGGVTQVLAAGTRPCPRTSAHRAFPLSPRSLQFP